MASGEIAQEIEVSITAPNRSFHATVVASDVSWQDRPDAADHQFLQQTQQPRRPIWSSAFGNSVDSVDSESYDAMVNSATSLSQDSYDGVVEFISSKEADIAAYMNGGIPTGIGSDSAAGGLVAAPEAASASACVAAAAATDAVTASIGASPTREPAVVGFAENDRGSISCEMMTASPVLVANGTLPTGRADDTVAPATVTPTAVIDTTSTTTVAADGETGSATIDTTTTVTSEVTLGSTFQMTPIEAHDEDHAEAPDTPRDRAMSMHERSLLAHDLHSLASTMETIKDEEEEVPVSTAVSNERVDFEAIDLERRASMTGVPISATSFIAPSQPTIFEGAEPAAEDAAAAASPAAAAAAASDTAAPAADAAVPEAADEMSPYLRRLLDAQEQTRQLMELLGESTQMLGALPTSKHETAAEPAEGAATTATATAAESSATETSSSTTFSSQSSSTTMTSSSTFSGSTLTPSEVMAEHSSPLLTISPRPMDITFDDGSTAVAPAAAAAAAADSPVAASEATAKPTDAAPAAPSEGITKPSEEATVTTESSTTVTSTTDVINRPSELTPSADDVTKPTVTTESSSTVSKTADGATVTSESSTTVTKSADGATVTTESSSSTTVISSSGTQNESICNALSGLQAAMTTVTTTSTSDASSPTTATPPTLLDATVLLQAHSVYSPAPAASPAPADATPEPDTASLLHDATVSLLAAAAAAGAAPPSPTTTVAPGQEVFVTSAVETEITKTTFTSESSAVDAAASAAAGPTSTTDYVEPRSSVVLQAEESAAAAAPAAQAPPVTTPAAVDVPVEIVRHLDDPASWHSAAPTTRPDDSTGHAVPISIVDAGAAPAPAVIDNAAGPPRLAHEPPVPDSAPAGPPPLAREQESSHDFSRSVMVERRVLSPDSAAHAAAADAEAQQPVLVVQLQQQAAADSAAPQGAVQQPQEPAAAAKTTASIDIPVSLWQQSESTQDATKTEVPITLVKPEEPADAVREAIDIPVSVSNQSEPTQDGAKSEQQAPVVQQPQDAATAAEPAASIDIPVSVWNPEVTNQTETKTDVSLQSTQESATVPDTTASVDIPVTVSNQSEPTQDAAKTEVPITEVKPEQPADAVREAINIPVSVSEPTQETPKSESPVLQPAAEPAAAAAGAKPIDIPVSMWQQAEEKKTEDETTDVKPVPTDATVPVEEMPAPEPAAVAAVQQPDAAAAASAEAPIATSVQQEQPVAAAPAAADALTTPTTAQAPMSLDSMFQISPSDDDVAQPPTMPRDRAMSIHEKSLLAHEPSGFQSGLEPLPESPPNEEVHVASAEAEELARRRASLAPGDGAPTAAFQLPSTSCLFTVDEGAAPEDSETAPPSTASPSNESASTTIASSTADTPTDKQPAAVIDVTAPAPAAEEAAPPPPTSPRGVQWLTESESAGTAPVQHEKTPDSPATIVAASEALPQTPKTPSGVSWVTEPTPATSSEEKEASQSTPVPDSQAQPVAAPQPSEVPQTPKTPTGVSWITEPAAAEPTQTKAEPAPAVDQVQPQPAAEPVAEVPPTPKTPTGVSWITEPASAPVLTQSEPTPAIITTNQSQSEPALTSVPDVPPTPKTPTGVSWITEPSVPASVPETTTTQAPSAQSTEEQPPPTPKTPSGVSWITEAPPSGAPDGAAPAATSAAPPSPISVINITAPPGALNGERVSPAPRTPTSPGIQWSGESTMTGGNVPAAGGAPAPDESSFLINAPWSGADPALAAATASEAPAPAAPAAPDADGVTWITEKAASPKDSQEESVPRPPLTRSESTRSDRDGSTATDITVRASSPPQRKTLGPSVSGEEDLASGVMQESQGTKVRKLSWADQQPSSIAEDSFNIDEYEKKLNDTTAQTKELVDLLCQTGAQISENSMKMSDVFTDAVEASVRSMMDQERKDRQSAALPPIAENGESISREPPPQLVAGALPPNVESVIVSSPELKCVTGSLVLENAHILVTDEESGMFLFTLDSKIVRHVTNPNWKRAASPVIFKDRLKSYILVLMDCKDEKDGAWVRHVVKFSENLDYMEKAECPKWIREKTVISDRLAVNRYENIFYCANGEIFSGLYELAPTGKWTELLYRQSESFIDMLAFSIIGPIQQILIVEGRRDHVLLCSIRESTCVEAKRMAICERPGALAKDESGRLFVMNRAQAAIQIVDTRYWASCRNMALVDRFVPHFSAAFGMLAIPQKRAVKVHKYSFEWDD